MAYANYRRRYSSSSVEMLHLILQTRASNGWDKPCAKSFDSFEGLEVLFLDKFVFGLEIERLIYAGTVSTDNSSVRVIRRNPAYALNGDSGEKKEWRCQGDTAIFCTLRRDAMCTTTAHAYRGYPRHRLKPRQVVHASSDNNPQNGQLRPR